MLPYRRDSGSILLESKDTAERIYSCPTIYMGIIEMENRGMFWKYKQNMPLF